MAGMNLVGNNLALVLIVDGKSLTRTVDKSSPAFKNVVTAINAGKSDKEILEALDVTQAIKTQSNGKVTVEDGVVKYMGEAVHDNLAKKIVEYMGLALPYSFLMRFLENLMESLSYNTRQHLFNFLQHKGVPITEDGCFLAQKVVRSDYLDKFSGTISNHVGAKVSMDRGKIDDNPNSHCSKGLHCGAIEYIGWYGNQSAGDKVVIVKVNPKDVVSVPNDHSFMKIRVCYYEVVAEGEFDQHLRDGVYAVNPSGTGIAPVESDVDEDLDDGDWYEDDDIEDFGDESDYVDNEWDDEEDYPDDDEDDFDDEDEDIEEDEEDEDDDDEEEPQRKSSWPFGW